MKLCYLLVALVMLCIHCSSGEAGSDCRADFAKASSLLPGACYQLLSVDRRTEGFADLADDEWRKTGHEYPHQSFGIGKEVLWLKVRDPALPDDKYYLISYYSWLDQIDVYLEKPDALIHRSSSGRESMRFPIVAIPIEQTAEISNLYVRVESDSEKYVGFHLVSEAGFRNHLLIRGVAVGTYQFLAGLLVIVALILLLRYRDPAIAYYLVFLFLAAIYVMILFGGSDLMGKAWIQKWSNALMYMVGFLGIIAVFQFWRAVLNLGEFAPFLDRLSALIVYLVVPFSIVNFLFQYLEWPHFQDHVVRALTALVFLWTSVVAVYVWRRRYLPALFYFIGATVLGLTFAIHMFAGIDPIPGNVLTSYALLAGLACDHVFFMISILFRIQIGDRLGLMREQFREERQDRNSAVLIETGAHLEREAFGSSKIQGGNTPDSSQSVQISGETGHTDRVLTGEEQTVQSNLSPAGSGEASSPDHTSFPNSGVPARLRGLPVSQLRGELVQILEVEKLYCDEDMSLQRLADLLDLSRHQTTELIKYQYACGFYAAVRKLRIMEASRLLGDGDKSILQVALAVGYRSKSTFNSDFREILHMTPSAYRKNADSAALERGLAG